MTNGSWLELVAGGDPQRAHAQAERAVQVFVDACKDAWEEQNARVNLALAAFQLERLPESRTQLERAVALSEPQGWVRAWQQEIEAELDLREGDVSRAVARFRALVEREEQGGPVASQHRALLGLGRALLVQGDVGGAEAALRRAEGRLDFEIRTAPLGSSRDAFASMRLASAELLVDLLVDTGRVQAALEVARRARVRPLHSLAMRGRLDGAPPERQSAWESALSAYHRAREKLDALHRDEWSHSIAEREQLTRERTQLEEQMVQALDAAYAQVENQPPLLTSAKHTVLDLFFFASARGEIGFARTASEVVVVRLPKEPKRSANDVAQAFLRAFADRIRAASQLRVMPYGALRSVDFHALPFDSGLLNDRVFVSYGVDVASEAQEHRARTALVVIDPRADLPDARREGMQVRKALAQRYESVIALSGQEATLSQMRRTLVNADWLHFAGHGRATSSAVGLTAELSLADNAVLEAGDILALPRVPKTVVLAGCETGVDDEHAAFGWGMAQAFVVRGAEGVVATQRRVSDEAARSFSRELYAQTPSHSLALRVHAAVRALREAGADDWPAFRLYTP